MSDSDTSEFDLTFGFCSQPHFRELALWSLQKALVFQSHRAANHTSDSWPCDLYKRTLAYKVTLQTVGLVTFTKGPWVIKSDETKLYHHSHLSESDRCGLPVKLFWTTRLQGTNHTSDN